MQSLDKQFFRLELGTKTCLKDCPYVDLWEIDQYLSFSPNFSVHFSALNFMLTASTMLV